MFSWCLFFSAIRCSFIHKRCFKNRNSSILFPQRTIWGRWARKFLLVIFSISSRFSILSFFLMLIVCLSGYFYHRYDANANGHRLYKEIITLEAKVEAEGNECFQLPTINFQWETLASNFEEFSKVAVRSYLQPFLNWKP